MWRSTGSLQRSQGPPPQTTLCPKAGERGPRSQSSPCSLFPISLVKWVPDNREVPSSWQNSQLVQSLSHVQLFATPWTAAHQASLSITTSWSLLKLTSIKSVMPSNHLTLCCLSPSPPALNLSQHQGLFKWVTSSHQVAKVLELQLQHQSFQWTPRTDLF